MIGQFLGPYQVVSKLGEGGMGEVYRARDTRLDRDVALKILPDAFATDPERLARFEREARTLASLSHANIAQIYGIAEGAPLDGARGAVSESRTALVMELIDGEDLSAHIARGPMALVEALPIAKQIAAALEAAHEHGIVHRDLKPANIKLREDGTVKVLDFGLAKALAVPGADGASPESLANSPTLTARATQMGMILGTAAYMSPEQASGRAVDRRADIWAFGTVLYEMLTGRRAFDGDHVSEVIACVLKTEPDWTALPADLPAPAVRLLRRCLEKDPRKRLRDLAEGMLQLEDGLAALPTATSSSPLSTTSQAAVAGHHRIVPIAVTAIVVSLATFGAIRWMTPAPAQARPVHFVLDDGASTLTVSPRMRDVAISPDGYTVVALAARSGTYPDLLIRKLDRNETVSIKGGQGSASPFFSPDGQWIGTIDPDGTVIRRIALTGGTPVVIARSANILGATWRSDGTIIFGTMGGPLYQVSEKGGTPEPVTTLDATAQESDHLWPSAVPGTSVVLFLKNFKGATPITSARQSTVQLAAIDLATKKSTNLGITGGQPRYLAPGWLLYVALDGTLQAMRFDPSTLSVSGQSELVLDSVSLKSSGAANYDLSSDGHLAFIAGGLSSAASRTIAWVDRAGKETPIAAPARNYFYARVSPDGKMLSLDSRDQEEDVWIWDLERENLSRVTDKPGADQYGLWTRDSQRVIFLH